MSRVLDRHAFAEEEEAPPQRGLVRWLIHHAFSFEMVMAAYLYSNAYKLMFPGLSLPVDETAALAGLSIVIGAFIVVKEGIYMRGLIVLGAMTLFLGWVIIGWSWTPGDMITEHYLTYFFSFDIWCVVAGALILSNRRERMARFFVCLLVFSLVLVFIGIYIYLVYGNFRFYEGWEDQGRVYNRWGYAASMGTVVCFAILVYARHGTVKQLVFLGLFVASMFFLLIASSRGSLLATMAGLLGVLLCGTPKVGHRRLEVPRVQVLSVLVFIAGTIIIIFLMMMGEEFHTFNRFVKLFEQAQNTEIVVGPNRFAYYQAAVDLFIREPLTGFGVGSFSMMFRGKEVLGIQPHNIVLELLAEHGLIGFTLFMFFIWTALRQCSLRRLQRDPLLVCALMLFLSRFMAAMYSTELATQQILFLSIALLALRPPERDEDEDEDDEEEDDDEADEPSTPIRRRPAVIRH